MHIELRLRYQSQNEETLQAVIGEEGIFKVEGKEKTQQGATQTISCGHKRSCRKHRILKTSLKALYL